MTDRRIDAAIAAEERELLRQIGEEPGYFAQLGSMFTARGTGGMNIVLVIIQTALFIAGAYAAWQFFAASDVLIALRWGLPAMTLLLMSLIIKIALYPVLHINRVLVAVKRLAALIAAGGAPGKDG